VKGGEAGTTEVGWVGGAGLMSVLGELMEEMQIGVSAARRCLLHCGGAEPCEPMVGWGFGVLGGGAGPRRLSAGGCSPP